MADAALGAVMMDELSWVIRRGDRARAMELLEQGADARGRGEEEQAPLILALRHDFDPIFCEVLLARGASLALPRGCSALFAVTQGASEKPLAWLAQQGAPMGAKDDCGRGLFHWLATRLPIPGAQRVGLAMAEEALRLGAPLDEIDARGWSPLGLATVMGNAGLALWLLDHGALDARSCGQSGADQKDEVSAGVSLASAARGKVDGAAPGEARRLAEALASRLESLEQARELSEAAPERVLGVERKRGLGWM